jgi:hypothetical protein
VRKTESTATKTASGIKKLNLRKERVRVLAQIDLKLVAGGSCETCTDGDICDRQVE